MAIIACYVVIRKTAYTQVEEVYLAVDYLIYDGKVHVPGS